jgi:hypothetical protein
MGDYNLSGLNPHEFEHLVQALALAIIAPGVMPFGDGPDGGREATFRGRMAYPSVSDPWEGYLVIQAKFRQRPAGDPYKDDTWLLDQLKQELDKFVDTKRKLPRPEYYLLVTNVALTPVQDSGSKDRALALLAQRQMEIGYRGYGIWDYDHLRSLLDGQEAIRNRYLPFIGTGDVLAEVMCCLHGQPPDFESIVSRFLQEELCNDLYSRLEQTGHTTDDRIPLARVFVDLPAGDNPMVDPQRDDDMRVRPGTGLLADLLQHASQILKPSVCTSDVPLTEAHSKRGPEPGHFVIVGGPGQGKSTLGQFLCQLYRAGFLKDQPRTRMSRKTQDALDLFLAQCSAADLDLPTARRFPIRIVLDQFASALNRHEATSVLSYLVKRLNSLTDSTCSVEDLRRWLGAYPWLIILDGLDEVPPSSNRAEVMREIERFWQEVAQRDVDVMVVATTRPQGYNDDFSPDHYQHLYLLPLSRARALHYAERLTEVKYGSEPERKARVRDRLRKACEGEATVRLMRSPLQVTIMTTLVDQIGEPPQERWRLFHEYYEVIYRRETERDIPASRILQQRKTEVNDIHHQVALLLQVESETAGRTEAWLPKDRFHKLVRTQLAAEEFEGEELNKRTQEITEAALQRLVFLVGLQSDRIGFEIRSFQEFMAAEALMAGRDEDVQARLEAIAPIAHWRNVFLFAAGKCFADRRHLRDTVVRVCEHWNDVETDRLAGATLAGSRLALDLLLDGVAGATPKYARRLGEIALRLMEAPDIGEHWRLAAAYQSALETIFQQRILQRLGQAEFADQRAAWKVLATLAGYEVPWAQEMAEAHWPQDLDQQVDILQGVSISSWGLPKMVAVAPHMGPHQFSYWTHERRGPVHVPSRELVTDASLPAWFRSAARLSQNLTYGRGLPGERVTRVKFGNLELAVASALAPAPEDLIPLKDMSCPAPEWLPYISSLRFANRPEADTLAAELRILSTSWKPSLWRQSYLDAPWPLAACLAAGRTDTDLLRLAERAERGEMGRMDDWSCAEERWQQSGITDEDLVYLSGGQWPFDAQIRERGFPFAGAPILNIESRRSQQAFDRFWALFQVLPQGPARTWCANAALDSLIRHSGRSSVPANQLRTLLGEADDGYPLEWLFEYIRVPDSLDEAWIDFLDGLGRSEKLNARYWYRSTGTIGTAVARAYADHPERTGLLPILARLVAVGGPVTLPKFQSLLTIYRLDIDNLRGAALFIRTVIGRWSPGDAFSLAHEWVEQSHLPYFWLLMLIFREGRARRTNQAEALFLALYDVIITARGKDLRDVISVMNELMRKRKSGLNSLRHRTELKFPVFP